MTDRELLKQALDALVDSYDDVVQEHGRWLAVYGNIPTRAAQKAQGDKIVADHQAAIDAIRARLAEPEPVVKWLGGVISDSTGTPICELKVQQPMDRADAVICLNHILACVDEAYMVEAVRAVEKFHGIE